jgi:hypothetical protein
VARIAAIKAIGKAVRDLSRTMGEGLARETLMRATERFAASDAGQRGQFTPHPATWFNQGRYMDNPQEWERISNDRTGKTASSIDAARAAIQTIENRRAAHDPWDTPPSKTLQ